MDRTPFDFVVDVEMCKRMSEAPASPDPFSADKLGKRVFYSTCDDEQLIEVENGLCLIKDEHEHELSTVPVTTANRIDKKKVKDKRKSTSAKKPPRPPRGLSLDAADQKLIKEIAELAMIKRARIERIKALKKMKAAKASSTSPSSMGSVLAFLFSVLFFLILCFQGMSSGSSAVSSHDSPEPSGSRSNSFIIQQYYTNLSGRTAAKSAGYPKCILFFFF
ncbi:uncharacterized protein LOC107854556 isoform X1 [Capsicum annuum]|uniref:uncharacterized protein LOC107854556 isoform X1 n=1 Tax=Capsicum annuum TaxID=4072 RepID=UPI001FB05317|nr:uncharacterized protein LOC107854556 isoform X1 [Capsicum annuum]